MDQIKDIIEGHHEHEEEAQRHEVAAICIQRAWRKRSRAKYLNSDTRWHDIALHARLRVARDDADGEVKNDAKERWRRAAFLASRLHDSNRMFSNSNETEIEATRKHLETQHWLELIDGKHRYGSNLKFYHRYWQKEDTKDNFFRWLDQGAGKDLSLKECSREQLEKEVSKNVLFYDEMINEYCLANNISVLRANWDTANLPLGLNYLVKIDAEGKLRWHRTGQLVDSTAGRWKDSGNGGGIVPLLGPDHQNLERRTSFASLSSVSSANDPAYDEDAAAMHYASNSKHKNWFTSTVKRNLTMKGVGERLLRKTVRRNTWIYVADKNFNMFIGIKQPGTFQHSSLLGGGLVASAGLITVKRGVIHTLSPLSGHYRTSITNFRQFTSILRDRGVDMHKVKYSKAEAAIWGIEKIGIYKKKKKQVVDSSKAGIEKVSEKVSEATSKEQEAISKLKREVLHGKPG